MNIAHTHTHTHTLSLSLSLTLYHSISLGICNIYCFSTAIMVARTPLYVMLNINCLSRSFSNGTYRNFWQVRKTSSSPTKNDLKRRWWSNVASFQVCLWQVTKKAQGTDSKWNWKGPITFDWWRWRRCYFNRKKTNFLGYRRKICRDVNAKRWSL